MKINNYTTLFFLLLVFYFQAANAQGERKKILFLGNSYTYVNDLPKMLYDIAAEGGDTIIYESNTPGGYTLQGHSTDFTSLFKIQSRPWDFVVLQEQSQLPSFPDEQVETEVFPYARALDSLIKLNNSCTRTVFYMTWGRKNGDASNCAEWPPVCTYAGMDSLLNLRYTQMATTHEAILSPVGEVWKLLRNTHPEIELYQADESHPSVAGTYAAALSFYSLIYRKSPIGIQYAAGLSDTLAKTIQWAVNDVVSSRKTQFYLKWQDPQPKFEITQTNTLQLHFQNLSIKSNKIKWYFGDGDSSELDTPTHTYKKFGKYTIRLLAENCAIFATDSQTVTFIYQGIDEDRLGSKISIYPNPAEEQLGVNLPNEEVYQFQIFSLNGIEISPQGNIRGKGSISLSGLSPGVYLLAISNSYGNKRFLRFTKL